MEWLSRWQQRLRVLFRREEVERELDEELAFHVEMETEKNLRAGMCADEARRQAILTFGSAERHKEEVRDARWLGWMSGLSLDLRLGIRLLRKHPALTVVGALAMAFAICVGALAMRGMILYTNPTLPLDEGDRVVGIQLWDTERSSQVRQSSLVYSLWKEELRSIAQIGAFRNVGRNLAIGNQVGSSVLVAEITASAFPLTRTPPLLGRTLIPADEQPGSPPVVVIGYRFWKERLDGDTGIVGREVRISGVPHVVVGVMPEGFVFPINHQLWTPLQIDPGARAPGIGPALNVFGRLVPGSSLRAAQSELSALDSRLLPALPASTERLRSRVMSYPRAIIQIPSDPETRRIIALICLLLVSLFLLICGNVALLLFARAATRQDELAVRSALGATRRRIVTQLFAEALVLAGVAAVVGTGALWAGVSAWRRMIESGVPGAQIGLPFWYGGFFDSRYLLVVGLLTLLAATVVGAGPALQVTGRELEPRLREGAAGAGAVRFAGIWTALIVTQVAVTVFIPALALQLEAESRRYRSIELSFSSEQYLAARVVADDPLPGPGSVGGESNRIEDRFQALERALLADPQVRAVSYTSNLPNRYHPLQRVELDGKRGPSATSDRPPLVGMGAVGVGYFEVLGLRMMAGRGFRPADLAPGARVVVVNQSLASSLVGRANPVGARVRYRAINARPEDIGEWHEVVGVVEDLEGENELHKTKFYYPVSPGGAESLNIVVHVGDAAAAFGPRLSAIAYDVDPALRLFDISRMDELNGPPSTELNFSSQLLLLIGALALLLSLAAIYSVMSYAVSRRTREIGVRVALGANKRRIIAVVFRRPLIQTGAGILIGTVAVAAVGIGSQGAGLSVSQAFIVGSYTMVMTMVCMSACVVPTRRALRIEPTEAMRADL